MWWILLVLVFFIWAWGRIDRRDRTREHAIQYRQRAERIDPESQRNTIHIVMVCMPGEEHECADTLYSVFDDAEQPWRITIGLAYQIEREDPFYANPLDIYAQRCVRYSTKSFDNNIYTVPILDASDESSKVRSLVFDTFCKKRTERYVMSLVCGAKMVTHWDTKIIRMYQNTERSVRHPCITSHPPFSSAFTVADVPTFSVLEPISDGFPRPKPMFFSSKPTRCYPTPVYCPKFSFGDRHLASTLRNINTLLCAPDAEPFVCTHRLLGDGWNLVSPNVPVIEHIPSTSTDDIPDYQHKEYLQRKETIADIRMNLSDGPERSLKSIETHTGLYADGRVMPHARAGCTAHPGIEEQICKFGSEMVYSALIQSS